MIRRLGQLEAVVMDRVWAADGPVVVRDVLEDLQREREIAYTTVMTVMDNLHTKGFLTRRRQGRAYAYRARRTREEHTAEVMEEALAAGGDRTATLMHFVEHISTEEMDELKAALKQLARQKRRGS